MLAKDPVSDPGHAPLLALSVLLERLFNIGIEADRHRREFLGHVTVGSRGELTAQRLLCHRSASMVTVCNRIRREMIDQTRRHVLRNGMRIALGTVAGAGGMLLPLSGGNAIELEDQGAQYLGVVRPLPVSPECLELRAIVGRQRHLVRVSRTSRLSSFQEWRDAYLRMSHEYTAIAETVLARPVTSWAQASEIAEIAWRWAPKAWQDDIGLEFPRDRPGLLEGTMDTLTMASGRHRAGSPEKIPHAVLIEAVLTLCGGERNDPNDFKGRYL